MEVALVNSHSRSVSFVLALTLFGGVFNGASAQSEPEGGKRAIVVEERRQGTAVYPTTVSGTPLSEAGILAGDKDKRAFINYTVRPNTLVDLVFSASTPLAEQGPSTLLQLDGFTGKTRLGFQAHFGFHRLPSEDEASKVYLALESECKRLLAATPRTPSEIEEEKATGISERGCDYGTLAALDPKWFATTLRPYRRASWFLTFKGDVGPDSFEFVDRTTFTDQKTREWSHSVSAVGGVLLPSNVYFSVGVRGEHAYADAKSQAVCTVQTTPTAIACPTKVVGPPTEKTRGIIEGEVRRFAGSHAGLSTIWRYDWKSGDKSLDFPVYLVQDKDGGLRGGVSYGYTWSDDGVSGGHRFSVFVGQTFKLGG